MQTEASTFSGHTGETPWPARVFMRLSRLARPYLGWPVFGTLLALASMPAYTLISTEWVALPGYASQLLLMGPLGVCVAWYLVGWSAERNEPILLKGPGVWLFLLYFLVGVLVTAQLVVGIFPGPILIWNALYAGEWLEPFRYVGAEAARLWTRLLLWQQGTVAGGAGQDNLVVALLFGVSFWLLSGLAVLLARKTRRGLIAALPFLWIVLMQLAYSTISRGAFVYALMLAILLHLLLDQERLIARWVRMGLDYNPGIGIERTLIASLVVALVMGMAAIFPNLYVAPVAQAYYDLMIPISEQMDGSMERVLPEAQGVSRMRRSGIGGGMPNDFLLQGGPDLRQIEVLRYRTNEPYSVDFPFEEIGPPGHYMRGGTFAIYNGRGWGNPPAMERVAYEAEERRFDEFPTVRRELVQSISLTGPTQILYAAPEIVEASVGFRLESRGEHDVVAAWSRERSYTVVSALPAVSMTDLRQKGTVQDFALDEELMAMHLALPDTVTERTRQLVEEVIDGHETAYDQANAIEAYLRTYLYDLTVTSPPGNVQDITDYFLFELQRGYCDYYATAFVVMARLAGLPARFATGFSTGYWNPGDASHVVTEADAHSWAEVYFPEVGWIPFEPTAAQPLFLRVGRTTFAPAAGGATIAPPSIPTATESARTEWNWQVWLWALPVVGLAWLVYRYWESRPGRRREPWTELLQWGRRLGRPIEDAETPLEYGHNLGEYVRKRVRSNQDTGRLVAREMAGLGTDISNARYGRVEDKPAANAQAAGRWARLRGYRRSLRV